MAEDAWSSFLSSRWAKLARGALGWVMLKADAAQSPSLENIRSNDCILQDIALLQRVTLDPHKPTKTFGSANISAKPTTLARPSRHAAGTSNTSPGISCLM